MRNYIAIFSLLTIYLLLPFSPAAQRNNVWYFGFEAGLDFNATDPTTLPVRLNNSAMKADEGCGSVSDDQGRILFYTNGVTVYNRNHEVMANGNDIGGHPSGLQSGLIVQHPGVDKLYYIFTTDAYENANMDGHKYAIVDITANDSSGVVLSKNNVLWWSGTERLAACRHANGVDVWVITTDANSNIFRSWLVNCNGLQNSPVVSIVGEIPGVHDLANVGALRFSPDGKMLCQTHFQDLLVGELPPDFFQLYDFDRATGQISNARKIELPASTFVNSEFSPSSEYLYVVKGSQPFIEQFNVKLPTAAAITASHKTIPAPISINAIQLGPDKRIYVGPYGNTCAVINKPDLPWPACEFIPSAIQTRAILGGFPSVVNDLPGDPYNAISFQITDSCVGTVSFSGTTNLSGTLGWHWDFGDGSSSTLQNPTHTYSRPDSLYRVKLVITSLSGCGKITRALNIRPKGIAAVLSIKTFGGCDSGYVRLENHSTPISGQGFQYIWDFGDGTTSTELHPKHVYQQTGTYTVKLKMKTSKACLDDSVSTTVDMTAFIGTLSVSPDKAIFAGQTVQLSAIGPAENYEWTPSLALNDPHIPNPKASPVQDITYTVKVSNDVGCFLEKEVKITVVEPLDVYIPSGFTPNDDGKNDLLRPIFGSKYVLEEFSVYNRWGEKIFSTTERWAGWNGRIRGQLQQTGMYIWMIRIKDPTGSLIERSGSSVLIR